MYTARAFAADESDRVAFGEMPIANAAVTTPAKDMPADTSAFTSESGGFYSQPRIDWRAAGFIIVAHVILIGLLIRAQVIQPQTIYAKLNLLDISEPASPAEMPPPPKLIEPEIYVPPPTIDIARPAPPITTRMEPPRQERPATPAVAAPPAPPTVHAGDLGATMISAEPPAYPMESRRRREQGTVVLMLLLGTDGHVADIRIERSSGYERLDKAALRAVRRWRWAPPTHDGRTIAVRGTVEIPFILKG